MSWVALRVAPGKSGNSEVALRLVATDGCPEARPRREHLLIPQHSTFGGALRTWMSKL